MLTRRHFAAIAAAIPPAAESPDCDYGDPEYAWTAGYNSARQQIIEALAAACARENPNFDRARFLKACGIDS